MSRKQLFVMAIAIFAALLMLGCGQTTTQQDEEAESQAVAEAPTAGPVEAQLLFVHSAESASLAEGVLTLGRINDATIYFSDRPQRIAGHLTTDEFVENWGVGEDNFASDPPNAKLSILSGDQPQEIVVTIRNPRIEGDDLIYDVTILEGVEDASGGASSLFIDVIGRPVTPLSAAGVARRTTRRAVIR